MQWRRDEKCGLTSPMHPLLLPLLYIRLQQQGSTICMLLHNPLGHPFLVVQHTEIELDTGMPLFGSKSEPLHCFLIVLNGPTLG